MNKPPTVDAPILSIIVVHYNTPDFLRQCLRSLDNSKLSKQEYEVIVIDNDSTEDIRKWLRTDFPSVRLIQNKENRGFSQANNQAIRQSRGSYILLLNPDTVVATETIPTMIRYMDEHQESGAATCRLDFPNGQIDDACHRGFPTPWNALCHFSGLAGLFPQSLLFNGYHLGYRDLDTIHQIDSACGAFLLVRRQAGEAVGWLDEDYFWYGEDLDFCYRLKQAGWNVMFISDVRTIHYKGVSSGIKKHSQHVATADESTRRMATKARFNVMRIFYRKHYMDKYPSWLTRLVFMGITVAEKITILKVKSQNHNSKVKSDKKFEFLLYF